MLITNDPWKTSGHLNDVTICSPVFRGGDRVNGRPPDDPKAELVLGPDDLVEVRVPGGGGYGLPADRDPAHRERDRVLGDTRA